MNNEPLMSAYEMAEKDRLDRLANQEFWENIGFKKGEGKGEKKERSRWVLNFLDSGMTPSQIAKSGNLPLSEVEAIAASR